MSFRRGQGVGAGLVFAPPDGDIGIGDITDVGISNAILRADNRKAMLAPTATPTLAAVAALGASRRAVRQDAALAHTAAMHKAGGHANLSGDFAALVGGNVPVSQLATGAPTGTAFLRGDGAWSEGVETTTGSAEKVSAHAGLADPHPGYVLESLVDAAGDLLVGTAADTLGRLAKGGALQVLRVNAAATALEYATPAGGGGGGSNFEKFRVRGVAMDRRHIAGIVGSNGSTTAMATGTLYLVPFINGAAATADRLMFEVVGGAASGVARAGIYSAKTDGTFLPDALLVDSGEMLTATAGVKEVTISLALAADTLYWFAVLFGVLAPTVRSFLAGSAISVFGASATNTNPATMATPGQAYGALPATAPAITAGVLTNSAAPAIGVRLV